DSKCEFTKLDGVAATAGPGLLVCLMVGLSAGKSIAGILKKPFLAINHLEGHALTPRIFDKIEFPYLLLLVSGGHTQFLIVEGIGRYKRIGTTIDDALGETFDKTAKMIGLEFPGGPKIEKLAENGNENAYVLPRPILNHPGCNLSFAGLKTAILQLSSKIKSEKDRENLAASFQRTINEILNVKCKSAMNEFNSTYKKNKKVFVISGGVSANKSIRNNLHKLSKEMGFENFFPPTELCSDNAVMIAWAGIERFKNGIEDNLEVLAKPRWPLDPKAPFLKGAGVKY
ncbi:MAG: tRNA (adenosine(37)-N6)-threonylcarbamoyltransferase complex transferase subunit TsaD, partial [Proteobacteria bacterium]|nr:tRNA (adenosine(37)-N6)-threonylcarbamoyltransferase complex transferase subunit TsaD [Pseudomonadota bacterium]